MSQRNIARDCDCGGVAGIEYDDDKHVITCANCGATVERAAKASALYVWNGRWTPELKRLRAVTKATNAEKAKGKAADGKQKPDNAGKNPRRRRSDNGNSKGS